VIPTLRLLEHVHGHLGWLAVAALLHPAIVLRNPKRRALLSVALSTSFVVAAGLLGAEIYPSYRQKLKQGIFIHAPTLGWCFERKEHLAVGAIALALVGCAAHLAAFRVSDAEVGAMLAKGAHRAYVAAFALALGVACLGVVVASYRTF